MAEQSTQENIFEVLEIIIIFFSHLFGKFQFLLFSLALRFNCFNFNLILWRITERFYSVVMKIQTIPK